VDVTEVARRTAARIERILRAHGRSLERDGQVEECDRLTADQPTLAVYYAAAAQGISVAGERAGKPTLRLVVSDGPTAALIADDDEPVAEVRGINVHAEQCVDVATVLRSSVFAATSPVLSQERLTRRADGRLELELKKVWRDGTRALVLEPSGCVLELYNRRRRYRSSEHAIYIAPFQKTPRPKTVACSVRPDRR